jgi:hypothetical protein
VEVGPLSRRLLLIGEADMIWRVIYCWRGDSPCQRFGNNAWAQRAGDVALFADWVATVGGAISTCCRR